MNYACLEYTFIFDPAAAWQNSYQFEKDLADFLLAFGLEAQTVKTVDGGNSRKILLVKRVDKLLMAGKDEPSRGPQGQLSNLQQKYNNPNANKPGRFYNTKGYMVRK